MKDPEDNQTPLKRKRPPFTRLTNAVLDDPRLGHKGLRVYVALCRFADEETRASWPGVDSLAAVARLSANSTRDGLKELVSLGYLEVCYVQRQDGSQTSNSYEVKDYVFERTKPLTKSRGGGTLHVLKGDPSASEDEQETGEQEPRNRRKENPSREKRLQEALGFSLRNFVATVRAGDRPAEGSLDGKPYKVEFTAVNPLWAKFSWGAEVWVLQGTDVVRVAV